MQSARREGFSLIWPASARFCLPDASTFALRAGRPRLSGTAFSDARSSSACCRRARLARSRRRARRACADARRTSVWAARLDRLAIRQAGHGERERLDVERRPRKRAAPGKTHHVPEHEGEVEARRIRDEHRLARQCLDPFDIGGKRCPRAVCKSVRHAAQASGCVFHHASCTGCGCAPRASRDSPRTCAIELLVRRVGRGGEAQHRMRAGNRAVRLDVGADVDFGNRALSASCVDSVCDVGIRCGVLRRMSTSGRGPART